MPGKSWAYHYPTSANKKVAFSQPSKEREMPLPEFLKQAGNDFNFENLHLVFFIFSISARVRKRLPLKMLRPHCITTKNLYRLDCANQDHGAQNVSHGKHTLCVHDAEFYIFLLSISSPNFLFNLFLLYYPRFSFYFLFIGIYEYWTLNLKWILVLVKYF